jgi:hypothetical protein
MNPITELQNSIDIILTPQFYTFIREELELKFSYQAKQIAGALFDDYLDNKYEYQYHVYKCNNLWCFFAYSIDEIDHFLESVGIEKHRVSKIYFAQQIIDHIKEPMLVDEKTLLQNIDEVVTVIPKRLIDSTIDYELLSVNKLNLKGGITMGSSLNSFISLKETVILGTFLILLGATFILDGNRIKASIIEEDTKLTALLDENPKYTSSLSRNSILSKYEPIDTKERAKRQAMKDISKLLSNKSQLKSLNIGKNKIIANIKTNNQNINRQVKEHAKSKKFTTSSSSLNVKVEKSI